MAVHVKRTSPVLVASFVLIAASAPLSLGCGSSGDGTQLATSAPSVSLSAAPAARGSAAAAPSAASAAAADPSAPAVSAEVASAATSAEAPPVEAPLPEVDVKNIGMHIGGGPNDTVTKAPIKRSVEPHFDAFRRCYAVILPPETGDVSVDLRIERDGGLAKLTKFKSALKGEGFEDCVRKAFDAIDFEKPKTGATVVSYSLRFTPKKP